MARARFRTVSNLSVVLILLLQPSAYGQNEDFHIKPLVKLVGFLNATPAPTNIRPILTLKLPGDERRYTFLVTEMKVMAGPLRTAESILSEVKPYTPNFHVRTSREIVAQIAAAKPTERLTILAEYSRTDRALQIQSFEKNEDAVQ